MKKGLLLINLGSPDHADKRAIRRYLAEFLADKRVIDLPAVMRYILLYGFILPFRPKRTAEAYQSIWTEKGSPLIVHSHAVLEKIRKALPEVQIELAMRYGQPSLEEALDRLQHCEDLTILPLYPQYSSAATGSSIEKCLDEIKNQALIPRLNIIRDFYQHPAFIQAQALLIQPYLEDHDHLLLSYHGLPERQLIKTGCKKICQGACKAMTESNLGCYRAQCFETTAELAKNLSLHPAQYSVAFQSRLGKTPWIKPYLDELLPTLAQQGIKRLAVTCPSFVADCLETLEEIGIRARKQWLACGGEELTLIPSLNEDDLWVKALIEISGF